MPRIRHTGPVGSILTAKGGGGGGFVGTAFTLNRLLPFYNLSTVLGAVQPRGIYFRPDGKRFFVVANDDNLYEFALVTAWRVDTATYLGSFLLPSMGSAGGFTFKPDGTKLFVTDLAAPAAIREYSLSTAWDISTISYVGGRAVSTQTTSPRGLAFNSSGSKVFVLGGGNVHEYSLSTPWSPVTAMTFTSSLAVPADIWISFNSDGTKLFFDRSSDDSIVYYTLSVPWSFSGTETLVATESLAIDRMDNLFLRADGLAVYSLTTDKLLTQFGGV